MSTGRAPLLHVVDVAGSGAVPGSGSTMGAGRFWPAVAAEPTDIEGIYIYQIKIALLHICCMVATTSKRGIVGHD